MSTGRIFRDPIFYMLLAIVVASATYIGLAYQKSESDETCDAATWMYVANSITVAWALCVIGSFVFEHRTIVERVCSLIRLFTPLFALFLLGWAIYGAVMLSKKPKCADDPVFLSNVIMQFIIAIVIGVGFVYLMTRPKTAPDQ